MTTDQDRVERDSDAQRLDSFADTLENLTIPDMASKEGMSLASMVRGSVEHLADCARELATHLRGVA